MAISARTTGTRRSLEERKTIYLCLAHMSEAGLEQKYVKEAFDTNWVVPMGPNVNAFEEDLRKFVTGNVESAVYQDSRWPEATAAAWKLNPALKDTTVVCLSAGTAAVHLALIGCGVKAGDEVCVQSFTFCASSHPITYLGAKPVFIGSEKDTWNMDPELLEKAIIDRKEKTGRYPKAIVPVALYGMPYDCERIMAIADKYGIPVVEDAAEGMGSRFNGQVLGTFGKYGQAKILCCVARRNPRGVCLMGRVPAASKELCWSNLQVVQYRRRSKRGVL